MGLGSRTGGRGSRDAAVPNPDRTPYYKKSKNYLQRTARQTTPAQCAINPMGLCQHFNACHMRLKVDFEPQSPSYLAHARTGPTTTGYAYVYPHHFRNP